MTTTYRADKDMICADLDERHKVDRWRTHTVISNTMN